MQLRSYSGYSDVNWFVRALRAVPVIAGAALLGGMIGGFAMFAIDSALNWEPAQRSDAGAASQASSVQQQRSTKPVRVVGGAIPDPSAGMSAPPPAPQQPHSSAPPQPQLSSQLLAPNPLGPASQLQPQTAPSTTNAAPAQNQLTNQTSDQLPPRPQNAPPKEQPTRWPDALSRAHENASNATKAEPQTPLAPVTAPALDANKSGVTDGKEEGSNRAISGNDQDRAASSRHARQSRRQTTFSTNGGGRNEGDVSPTAPSSRQATRGYERLYDSYGNRRQRFYSNNGEPPSAADARGDQDDGSYRSGARRYGRDAGYRNRSRVLTPEETDRRFDARQQREPFWGGGFFRGDRYQSDDY